MKDKSSYKKLIESLNNKKKEVKEKIRTLKLKSYQSNWIRGGYLR